MVNDLNDAKPGVAVFMQYAVLFRTNIGPARSASGLDLSIKSLNSRIMM